MPATITTLSDHPRKLLERAQARGRSATEAVGRAHRDAAEAEQRYQAARRQKAWWRRLLGIASTEESEARQELLEVSRAHRQAVAEAEGVEQEIRRIQAGIDGEKQFSAWLAAALGDDWSLLCGYQNKRGETDVVAVGPPAIWVIEVKNQRGRLVVDGEDWRLEKYDNYGNHLHDQDRAAEDSGGRSWGRQVGEIADELSRWLDRKGHRCPVRRAVAITNERTEVVVRRTDVDVVTADLAELYRTMNFGAAALDADGRAAVVDLIRADHQRHQRRRDQRRR